ncbi:MAG: sulfite exporter TauE/SafE family protein [Deltaproteobacteria bacterium]|nr:sulfite exporter TauE/SafE family protein [Deltaproteobacteria bacterium]MBW2691768.1 sulfite exporter TauE/SafE family protein [Deltaproteobacteria bacterium]
MELLDLAILCSVGLLTSMLSAVIGMAGGITLLSVMLLFFEPLVAIPIHGVVQLVSNSSRTYVQRKHVDWTILWRYSVMLVPMGFVGIEVAQALPPNVTRALIGVFVLIATWRRGWLLIGTHPERADIHRRFFFLGAVVGLINMTIGAAGPLIAPFFLKIGLSRQAMIGTKAACQAVGHLVKIAIFGVAGFVFAEYAIPLALLSVSVIAGTWIGSQVLESVNERWFTRLYKGVLTLVALRLVVWEGLAWLGVR